MIAKSVLGLVARRSTCPCSAQYDEDGVVDLEGKEEEKIRGFNLGSKLMDFGF